MKAPWSPTRNREWTTNTQAVPRGPERRIPLRSNGPNFKSSHCHLDGLGAIAEQPQFDMIQAQGMGRDRMPESVRG